MSEKVEKVSFECKCGNKDLEWLRDDPLPCEPGFIDVYRCKECYQFIVVVEKIDNKKAEVEVRVSYPTYDDEQVMMIRDEIGEIGVED